MNAAMPETGYDTSLQSWVMELPDEAAACNEEECLDPATWKTVVRPCGHGSLWCDRHIKKARIINDLYACEFCSYCDAPSTHVDYVRV